MESRNRTVGAWDAPDEELDDKHGTHTYQPDSGFAAGADLRRDKLRPDFARGIRQTPETGVAVQRRFSEGIEHTPTTPDKTVERRFSEGIEQIPNAPDKTVERRFSEGIERSPTSA